VSGDPAAAGVVDRVVAAGAFDPVLGQLAAGAVAAVRDHVDVGDRLGPVRDRVAFGVDRHGREVDCVVREGGQDVDTLGGGPRTATLRAAGQPAIDDTLRPVVSLGGYDRGDVLWASRQGGVHLIDGRTLRTWVAGEPLPKLIGISSPVLRRRNVG
jgi:hypothetical protein